MSVLNKSIKAEQLFSKLLGMHAKITPSALKIKELFKKANIDNIKTDHISFRSVGYKETSLSRLVRSFNRYGYDVKGEYDLADKHMDAIHLEIKDQYQDKDSDSMKILISQFNIDESPEWVQEEMLSCLHSWGKYNTNELFEFSAPWDKSFDKYNQLSDYSEYIGWFYAHGFVPDHFAIDACSLKGFNGIYDINYFLQDNDVELNLDGGSIKRDEKSRVFQSSTIANMVPVIFNDPSNMNGKVEFGVPGGYMEIIQRGFDENSKLFNGFSGESCEKLMTSTHRGKSYSDFEKKNSLAVNSVVSQIEYEAKQKELLNAESMNFFKN